MDKILITEWNVGCVLVINGNFGGGIYLKWKSNAIATEIVWKQKSWAWNFDLTFFLLSYQIFGSKFSFSLKKKKHESIKNKFN